MSRTTDVDVAVERQLRIMAEDSLEISRREVIQLRHENALLRENARRAPRQRLWPILLVCSAVAMVAFWMPEIVRGLRALKGW